MTAGPSDGAGGGIDLHLQRVAGLEVRSDEAADRRHEMRRLSESRELVDLLIGLHVRNERVGVLLSSKTSVAGVIIGVGADAFGLAVAPDGIRHDILLSRVVALDPMGVVGQSRPRADQDAVPSFGARLRLLQALERDVIFHTTMGSVHRGVISVVGPDHVVVADVIVATDHIEMVETPPADVGKRMGRP